MRAAADVVDDGDCSLVEFFLVMVLVFDGVGIDKVAEVCTRVPAYVVGIDVDFTQLLDHLGLVGGIAFGARSSGCEVGGGVLAIVVAVGWGDLDGWKGKGVGHLQRRRHVHANEEASRGGGKGLRAMLDDFHHHLYWILSPCAPAI